MIDPLKTVEEQLTVLQIKSAAGAKLTSFEIADLEKLIKMQLLLNGQSTEINETKIVENLSREDFQKFIDTIMEIPTEPIKLHIVKDDEPECTK